MSDAPPTHQRAFQLERLILFSDAVFAIAITLLVIEIKVPELHGEEATELALLHELVQLIPKFIGFFVSFSLIGLYWTRHHFLFGFLKDFDTRLIVLNLVYLLSIVLMPFSTGIFGEYSTPHTMQLKTPLIIYVANVCFTGFMLYQLWRHVGDPRRRLAAGLDPEVVQSAKRRAVMISAIFAAVIPVAFVNAYAARYVPLLLPIVLRLTRRRKPRPA